MYRDNGDFDWFKKYSDIREHLAPLIPNKDARILMLGCGNSTLSRDMYDDGYHNILNIDYSPVCIEKMREANIDRVGMEWSVMDIRKLDLPDNSFDVAIDKGTMDALLAGVKDPWNPSEEIVENCVSEVREVERVLKKNPESIFIYFTFGQPHFRRSILNVNPEWSLTIQEVGDWFSYFLYTLKYNKL
ncbi:S-adenosyl-L-methionine-dependent methyltransferase [Wallemia mellicola]|uniref:S-adenosyl-L-methionine-dependent methyltransferase n=1 Tax=Wallemia mellicola TaxID=1708541 RepID=A0A4T0M0D3_9BASI|nr:S-adenosyl-L-methionine-dependent methyltransferase [Wallemia mellicola]